LRKATTQESVPGIKRGKDKSQTRVLSLDEEAKLLDVLHTSFERGLDQSRARWARRSPSEKNLRPHAFGTRSTA